MLASLLVGHCRLNWNDFRQLQRGGFVSSSITGDQDEAQTGKVLALFLCRAHGAPMELIQETRALPAQGLDGDIHGKSKLDHPRQLLIIDDQTLADLGYYPGQLREQITIDFPGFQELPSGTLISVGEATLQISGPCEPCFRMASRLGDSSPWEWMELMVGQRGLLASVIAVSGDGWIRMGDPVRIYQESPSRIRRWQR